jgi:anti-anti-sigma factor
VTVPANIHREFLEMNVATGTERLGRETRLSIPIKRVRDVAIVAPRGEIDLGTVLQLEAELGRDQECLRMMVLDLSKVTFLDSMAVEVIVATARRLRRVGGVLLVIPGTAQAWRLLDLAGVRSELTLLNEAGAS